MALNSSGPISLGGATTGQSIAVELGLSSTGTISLNQTDVRALSTITTPNSTIIMPTNFYGKSNSFPFNLTGNDVNLRSAALAAGWDGAKNVEATVQSGVVILGTSTGGYALTINGSFPAGVSLINLGTIQGKGGTGGLGGAASGPCACYAFSQGGGTAGNNAGPAILASVPVTITNGSGIIGGGGGGGGGGQYGGSFTSSGGGGGGGAGYGTAGGVYNNNYCCASTYAQNGVLLTGGVGGTAYTCGGGGCGGITATGNPGGTGGASGNNGDSGSFGGGNAGACLVGNSNVTWVSFGTRNGPIS